MKTLPVSVLLGLLGWLSIGIAILLFGYIVAEAVLTGEVALSSRIRGSTVVPRTELPRMFWGIVAFCAVSGIDLGWLGIYLIKGARSVKRWSTYHYVRLTRRSSGLAYGKPLTFNVRRHERPDSATIAVLSLVTTKGLASLSRRAVAPAVLGGPGLLSMGVCPWAAL